MLAARVSFILVVLPGPLQIVDLRDGVSRLAGVIVLIIGA